MKRKDDGRILSSYVLYDSANFPSLPQPRFTRPDPDSAELLPTRMARSAERSIWPQLAAMYAILFLETNHYRLEPVRL